jgi:hypothetical protein
MKQTTNKLDAALTLLALLKKNIVADVVGDMSDEDHISLRGLCAACDIPAPQMSAAIAHLIKKVESLISSLITQLEAEIVEIEQKIRQAQDVLASKPKPGNGLKVKP